MLILVIRLLLERFDRLLGLLIDASWQFSLHLLFLDSVGIGLQYVVVQVFLLLFDSVAIRLQYVLMQIFNWMLRSNCMFDA